MHDEYRPKIKIEVEVEMDEGAPLTGFMFAASYQRLSDVLNDDRLFLPLMHSGGVTMLSKTHLRRVTPVAAAPRPMAESDEPYKVLGCAAGASDEELRQAYLRLTRENHPDKLRGLGVAADLIDFATRRMAAINQAYNTVRKQRMREPV